MHRGSTFLTRKLSSRSLPVSKLVRPATCSGSSLVRGPSTPQIIRERQPIRHPHRLASTRRSCHSCNKGSAVMASAAHELAGELFFLDQFAIRQWDDPNYSGTRISFDKALFVKRVHELHKEVGGLLVDGYAPFCKHVFVPNFVDAKGGSLEITEANKGLLQSAYTRRTPDELPVLTRWFPAAEVEVPKAKMLDIILYSREQIVEEHKAKQSRKGLPMEEPDLPQAPWGIISVKAQNEDYETPMQPITMMRNSLGKEEGGSGVPLDRAKYEASAAYWQNHAAIVAGESPSGE